MATYSPNQSVPISIMDNNNTLPLIPSKAYQPTWYFKTTVGQFAEEAFSEIEALHFDETAATATGIVCVWDGKSYHKLDSGLPSAGQPLISALEITKDNKMFRHKIKGLLVIDAGYDLQNKFWNSCPVLRTASFSDHTEAHLKVFCGWQ